MAFQKIRKFLDDEAAKGMNTVSIDTVRWYLDQEESANPIEIKKLELEHQRKMTYAQAVDNVLIQSQIENFKSIIAMGQNALKSILMINGGAAVAFIAFLNNNMSKLLTNDVLPVFYISLWWALVCFGLGTLFASIGYGLAYFTQGQYYKEGEVMLMEQRKAAWEGKSISDGQKMSRWHIAALGCCIFAYFFFFVGLVCCGIGFYRAY